MPSITVSDHVLERIRSLKQGRDATEDEVLRRILDQVHSDREGRLRAYENTDQDIQSTN
jgi:predicted CopG family antitoxin